eukprot:138323_1
MEKDITSQYVEKVANIDWNDWTALYYLCMPDGSLEQLKIFLEYMDKNPNCNNTRILNNVAGGMHWNALRAVCGDSDDVKKFESIYSYYPNDKGKDDVLTQKNDDGRTVKEIANEENRKQIVEWIK